MALNYSPTTEVMSVRISSIQQEAAEHQDGSMKKTDFGSERCSTKCKTACS